MRELQNCGSVVDNSCPRKCVTDFCLQPFRKRLRRSRRRISLQGDQIPQKDGAWNFRTPPCIEGDKVLGTTAINRQLVVA